MVLDVRFANRYGLAMLNTKIIDDLARQISESIPAGVKGMQEDVQKNIHSLLQGALAKLDLVTREEFDAQSQVLARTREKLEQLEQLVTELEEKKD
jgi:BMFP domain-containing protein YqiC